MKKVMLLSLLLLYLYGCGTNDTDENLLTTCSITNISPSSNFKYDISSKLDVSYSISPNISNGYTEIWLNDNKIKDLSISDRTFSIPHTSLKAGINKIKIVVSDNKTKTNTTADITMTVKIGDFFGGGIVFKVNENGTSGLITTANDIQGGTLNKFQYAGAFQLQSTGATSATDGKSNTEKLKDINDSAGRMCYYYDGAGFTDWYLPSFEELSILRVNGYLDYYNHYWSSTELSASEAKMSVCALTLESCSKTYKNKIRAIRQF